jgi:hypothetical protein
LGDSRLCKYPGFRNQLHEEFFCEKCRQTSIFGEKKKSFPKKGRRALYLEGNDTRIEIYKYLVKSPGVFLSTLTQSFHQPRSLYKALDKYVPAY